MKILLSMFLFGYSVGALAQPTLADEQLPHNFTPRKTVPYGCLFEVPALQGVPESGLAFDTTFFAPYVFNLQAPVRARGWRVGCHESDRSVLMLNVDVMVDPPDVSAPVVGLRQAGSDEVVPARLSLFNGPFAFDPSVFYPFTDSSNPEVGATYLIETNLEDFSSERYNSEVLLVLDWPQGIRVELAFPAFDSERDMPQFERPPLHGRYSGQWTVPGLPRQGLVLQVGETGERSFLFAVMFTYLADKPVWVVGNADFQPGANEVALDMQLLDGGTFFLQPLDRHAAEKVTGQDLGTMTIRANSCNSISADIDFAGSGFGAANLDFERLIRIAGYDCDQTQ